MKVQNVCIKYFNAVPDLYQHKAHSRKENALAALSILSYLSLVTPATFGITYLLSKIWVRYHSKNLPAPAKRVSTTANIPKTANIPNPVHTKFGIPAKRLGQIGGFSQSGNTCYIAATLQSLRQIPYIRQRLDPAHALIQQQNETSDAFELRKKVKIEIYNLFSESDAGKTINSKKFRETHELFYKHDQRRFSPNLSGPEKLVSLPGRGGDQGMMLEYILEVLELRENESAGYTKLHYWEDCNQDSKVSALVNDSITFQPKIIMIKRLNPFVTERVLTDSKLQNELLPEGVPLSKDLPLEIDHTSNDGTKCKYTLCSVSAGTSNHCMAYLKEAGHPEGWVSCNDGYINRVSNISKQHVCHYLYYADLKQ